MGRGHWFFCQLRKRVRALGLNLEFLPGGEYQRRHCHNKSSLLYRCLKINPGICCASWQKSIGMFFSKGETLQDRYCESQVFIHSFTYLVEDSFPSQGSETVGIPALPKHGGVFLPDTSAGGLQVGARGGASPVRPCILLGVLQCCRLGWPPGTEGYWEEGRFWGLSPWTRMPVSPAHPLTQAEVPVGSIQPPLLCIQLRPSPLPSPFPTWKIPG